MSESKQTSISLNNADKLYNSLSDSDKALITAMLNTAFVLLRSVQQVQGTGQQSSPMTG